MHGSPAETSANGRVRVDLEDGRYQRQTLISWWAQERLTAARVLVVGAGALGNELVKNLALAGVGTVVVIDMDHIENSNLSRCVFFREEDEGRPKAEVVCRRAAELNPEVTFVPVVGDVRHDLGFGDYAQFDVVLGGLDNREARLHVNQVCWKASVPWIDGAIEGLMGVMRVFIPPHSACYECTMSPQDFEILAQRRACSLLTREDMLGGKVPTTGTTGSIVAAMQVQELIKLLHADERAYGFAGHGVAYNGETHDSYTVTYPRKDDCLSHDTYALDPGDRASADVPLAELAARAERRLGETEWPLVVELEHELVMRAVCQTCGATDDIRKPASAVAVEDALCPTCATERQLETQHTFETTADLAFTPAQLALPGNDVVTVRRGMERMHFLVGDSRLPSATGETA